MKLGVQKRITILKIEISGERFRSCNLQGELNGAYEARDVFCCFKITAYVVNVC